MTPPEIQFWKRVAQDLGIEVETPFRLVLPDGTILYVSAWVKHFGDQRGMIVDADYSIIRPHTVTLAKQNFGYCGNIGGPPETYNRQEMIEVLADWEWSGPSDKRPPWLD